MAKLNIDIRTDEAFMSMVKSLVLEQINKLLGSKEDLMAMIRAEIDKRVDRIDKTIENKLEETIRAWIGETVRYFGQCGKSYSLNEVMKHRIDEIMRKILQEKIDERLKIVVKGET